LIEGVILLDEAVDLAYDLLLLGSIARGSVRSRGSVSPVVDGESLVDQPDKIHRAGSLLPEVLGPMINESGRDKPFDINHPVAYRRRGGELTHDNRKAATLAGSGLASIGR
jgi:hypothetical protein